ncbi:hypothetical protein IFM89_001173 [Coptis chinensis]|uniref:Uncharacterized protein n=1 Tax=Coptis chinensis TaxID=261450 RepID=A0A835IID2_9MAGN|nr:hypothetical protein IFM89_001173 [Coptis chinensis]
MNKRSRTAVSPLCSDIKKLHHATLETKVPRPKGAKKFKQNLKQEGAADQTGLRPITKDEEEVAETLFSLAKMSPNDMPRANRQTSDVNSSPLQEANASAELVTQGLLLLLTLSKGWVCLSIYLNLKPIELSGSAAPNEISTACQRICSTTELASLSKNLEGFSYQNSLPQLTVMGQPIGTGNNRFDLPLDGSTVLADFIRTHLPSRDANTKDIPLTDPTEIGVFTEFCHGTGSVQLAQHKVHLHKQKLRNGLWPVVNAVRIEEAQLPASGHKGSGTISACTEGAAQFWPGMLRVSHGLEVHGPCTWFPSTERQVRLDPSSRTGTTTTSVLTENLKAVVVDQRQSWKRCAAHVYISRLIQAYRTAEKRPSDRYHGGIKLVSSAQAQVPYLLPVVQRSPLMAFTLPSVPFVSSQSQLPQNMSSPYYHWGHHAVGSSKQQMEQYLWCGQQQQWAAQLAMQCRPGVSQHDSPLNHCARPNLSCYFPEMCDAKGSQQQQPFAISPSLRSYDEGGGGLQVVCSAERT